MENHTTRVIDLCGDGWVLRPDAGNVGLAEDWHRIKHNPPAWKPVAVPGAWQRFLGMDFHFVGWYRRTIAIPDDWMWQRSWLRFEAVATEARVWVNGCEVGRHVGDFLAFAFEISEHVKPGAEVEIVVRVDEVMGHITKGFHDMLSAHHGGLWQPVMIVGSGPVHVMREDVGVFADAVQGVIDVSVEQSGAAKQANGAAVRVGVEVYNAAGECVAEGGGAWGDEERAFECEVQLNAEDVVLWEPRRTGHTTLPPTPLPEREGGQKEDPLPGPPPQGERGRGDRLLTRAARRSEEEKRHGYPSSPSRLGLTVPPLRPGLMGVHVIIECRDGETGEWVVSDEVWERVGFRTVETDGRHILLNGAPIFLRGMLHWGHEPRHISPAAPPEQVRADMERLQEMGFNCICLCMWYAPRYFYEIADELGLLLWQEHPCWHSPMDKEYLDEYRRLFTGFMKRDRNRASVVIVSATCEHPCFDTDLAAWWWEQAKQQLPGKLHQVQTSSFAWSDPAQTDLYDEHTYDNNDRWVCYLHDLQDVLGEMETPKPFVMGESVLFTSWPDLERIACEGRSAEWWRPGYLESGLAFERAVVRRYGQEVLERFKQQADRYHLLGRKFQIERFRSYANHAGLVTNHLRDVPPCSCGFMDDFDQWRFGPGDTRGWLADVPLILEMPGHRRGFESGERVPVQVRVSNLSGRRIAGTGTVECSGRTYEFEVNAEAGEVGLSGVVAIEMPVVDAVTRVPVVVTCELLEDANEWDLWVFPDDATLPLPLPESEGGKKKDPLPGPRGEKRRGHAALRLRSGSSTACPYDSVAALTVVRRMTGLPFSDEECEWDELEKGYSRGFGIEAKSWVSVMPDTACLLPDVEAWEHGSAIPGDVRVIVAHRLTRQLVEFMEERGGRVVLLASKAAGGMGARYEWLFGGRPLVVEQGPLVAGDSEWIVDLLGMDLTHCHARVMPTEELGLIDAVEPLVRLVYTHDETSVKMYDFAWMAAVGDKGGLLIATSLDHGGGGHGGIDGCVPTTLPPAPLPGREGARECPHPHPLSQRERGEEEDPLPNPPPPSEGGRSARLLARAARRMEGRECQSGDWRSEGRRNAAGRYVLLKMVEYCVGTAEALTPGPSPGGRGESEVLRRLCVDGGRL